MNAPFPPPVGSAPEAPSSVVAPPILVAPAPAPSPRPAARGPFRELVRARVWKETLHLLLDLPIGIAWFTIVVTIVATSAGLVVTVVGLPLLALSVLFGRVIGDVERARARALLDLDRPAFVPFGRAGSGWSRIRAALGDGPGWMGLAYGVVMLPWGIAAFTIAVTWWSMALGLVSSPAWAWALPDGPFSDSYRLTGAGLVGYDVAMVLIGGLMLYLTPMVIHGLASIDRALVRGMLSPSREAQLTERVEQLQVSRTASVEGATAELRRIERDLHDGAQQRLVGLAMDLGLAKERLANDPDPARAAELVGRAHDEAKQAIAELRNLVRGIQPSVLTDLGLDPALSALAARSPVPVELDVQLADRPPSAIESAAYFVVAESLANIAKHSRAQRAWVRVRRRGDVLSLEIGDDGAGGAVEQAGGGLAGLRDRVTAVEGRLRLTSPAGGPTVLLVELPCAS